MRRAAAARDTIGGMDDALEQQVDGARAPRLARAWVVVLAATVVTAVLVVGAVLLVGPAPRDADAGLPEAPPPLALPSGTPTDAPLARAAALLAVRDLEGARAGFVDVVAEDSGDVAGQVGLVLSRWRATGPVSVERDLRQLELEYPESAFVALHLGLVQAELGEDRAARASFRLALELGRQEADPTSLRMASLADDLLHPTGFRGSMPVLVRPAEVDAAARPELRRLLQDVQEDDRTSAARVATQLDGSSDAMARVAAIAATFSKQEPEVVADRLDEFAADPKFPVRARDRAALHAALARLWSGEQRSAGCARLDLSTGPSVDAATRAIATPIHAELCS